MYVCLRLYPVLFAVPSSNGKPTFSCMESECPHLGKPLEKAPVQWSVTDIEDLVVVWYVCMHV